MNTISPGPDPACCAPGRAPTPARPIPVAAEVAGASRRDDGVILLPGGAFVMGTNDGLGYPADGEGPARTVSLRPFHIDACAVTNARFRRFARDTGYVTDAERYGWSFVFHSFVSPRVARSVRQSPQGTPWWLVVEGADWRRPDGPGSGIRSRMDHPVVHISWNDAAAYCCWADARLPTEAEWEYAARGGLARKTYPWGDDLVPNGEHQCNTWQGEFPAHDTGEDGFTGTCPVRAFPPNGFGLYNMVGNVWEWCSDWFSTAYPRSGVADNPPGPATGTARSMRGGSYLCHESYCNRYRVAARSSNTPDSSTGNLGFRCAWDA